MASICWSKIWGVGDGFDGMWSSVFDTLYTQVHLSSQFRLKLRRKRRLKLQHLCQIRSDIRTSPHLWFALFKLDELLMSLRKLFENASASEFLEGGAFLTC